MVTALKNYLSANAPAVITAAGLTAFDDYLDTPPNNNERRQACSYLAEGSNIVTQATESFIINFQLARETRPDKYLSVLWPLILAMPPETIGMQSLEDATHSTWYPGEIGSTAFLLIEVRYTSDLDDCQWEDDE
jgi:hypothetical protein